MARLTQPIHATRTAYAGRAVARVYRPLYEDRHPAADAIAAELAQYPALLRLRPRRIIADVMAVKRVGRSTAWQALADARRMVA